MIVSLLEDCFVTVVLTDLSLTFLLIILTEPPPPTPPAPVFLILNGPRGPQDPLTSL